MLSGVDFESLMMQMRMANVLELRSLLSFMNLILVRYREYERQYEIYQARQIFLQNNTTKIRGRAENCYCDRTN